MTRAERLKQFELDEDLRAARAIGCTCEEVEEDVLYQCPIHMTTIEEDAT